jgi:hypothetical protein
MLLCLALASCGTPAAKIMPTLKPPTPKPPTPTPHPQITLQTLPVGMAGVREVFPGAAGIVLSDVNLYEGDVAPRLSFYRYSTHAVEVIATPPAPLNAIADAAYGGDWVAYVAAPGKMYQWQLWAYNVISGERIEVDSAAQENSAAEWAKGLHVSASHLVWSVRYLLVSAGPDQWDTKVFDFSFATRATQLLYRSHVVPLNVMAMTDSALLVAFVDASTFLPTLDLVPHGGPVKELLKAVMQQDLGPHAAMNDQYVVWEDGGQDALTLYDLRTAETQTYWAQCYRPEMSSTAPYVICNQQPKHNYALIHLPDGALTSYGEDQDGSLLSPGPDQIYGGRVFHVSTNGDVQYFDLPAN